MPAKILASELSPYAARLRIACALKNLDYAFEPAPGGSGSADLKKITPFGRIPVLMSDSVALVESVALLDHLEDAHPDARSLRPADATNCARVRMIELLFDHNVVKALSGAFAQLLKPSPDSQAGRAALDEVTAELSKLAQFFDPQGPVVGGQWSIADCAIAPFAFLMDLVAPGFGAISPTQRVPRFAQWWSEASKLPEVFTVTAGMQKALAAIMAAKTSKPAS